MLPQSLLLCSSFPGPIASVNARRTGSTLVPHYLTERDYPWILRFYDEFLRFKGKKRRELTAYFQGELPFDAPEKKRALLLHLLLQASNDDEGRCAGKTARALRSLLFESSCLSPAKPESFRVLSDPEIIRRFLIAPDKVLEAAFSDLPMERKLLSLPEGLTPEQLALQTNLALAQGMIARSSEIEIQAEGEIRRVIRQAKLRRLICEILPSGEKVMDRPKLRISGPLSLFGHTTVYGRNLAELLPLLAWCNRFTLSAICRIRGRDGLLRIRSSDQIGCAQEPAHFDSRLEERFAAEFRAETPDWDLIREPEAFQTGGTEPTLIFPDFLIRHRREPKQRYFVEIVGYWTQDYLRKKIRSLEASRIPNLILCVDESLNCEENLAQAKIDDLSIVVFFRKKVPVQEILRRITRISPNYVN